MGPNCIASQGMLIHAADHSDHYFHTGCPHVRPFKISKYCGRTVGWPSGSLMTPVLFSYYFHFAESCNGINFASPCFFLIALGKLEGFSDPIFSKKPSVKVDCMCCHVLRIKKLEK